MLIRYSDHKLNTKTRIIFKCDNCGKNDDRNMSSHNKLKESNPDFDKDYCKDCWSGTRQKTKRAKERMSKAINNMIELDPDWKIRNSKSKKGKINLGNSNGMKKIEAREKVSNTRKNMMTSDFRNRISEYTSKAWADGKYEGVNVGRSKWHSYIHSNGIEYKVQGTLELEFIKWLDDNDLDFKCHKGRISYVLNGQTKSYYPDFFVTDWDQYVDIKNHYHYILQIDKFNALKEQGKNIRIIFKEELEQLIKKSL